MMITNPTPESTRPSDNEKHYLCDLCGELCDQPDEAVCTGCMMWFDPDKFLE